MASSSRQGKKRVTGARSRCIFKILSFSKSQAFRSSRVGLFTSKPCVVSLSHVRLAQGLSAETDPGGSHWQLRFGHRCPARYALYRIISCASNSLSVCQAHSQSVICTNGNSFCCPDRLKAGLPSTRVQVLPKLALLSTASLSHSPRLTPLPTNRFMC